MRQLHIHDSRLLQLTRLKIFHVVKNQPGKYFYLLSLKVWFKHQ